MKKYKYDWRKILKNRITWFAVAFIFLFIAVLNQFYELQIVNQEIYASNLKANVEKVVEIPAMRGAIYDRYGKPLVTNKVVNVLKIDQETLLQATDINQILLNLIKVLEYFGDSYVDEVPISLEAPFVYTKGESGISQFLYQIPYKNETHRKTLLTYSAEELIAYLRSEECFQIDERFTESDARKIIALRTEISKLAYKQYKAVTVAKDISKDTLAYIEENQQRFPSISIDVDTIRYYHAGEIMGNLLGYTRPITTTQYEEMKDLGYDKDDVVGHEGIEKSQEALLRGENGVEYIQTDDVGKKVNSLGKVEQTPGNDVFLTIDLDLQTLAYQSIEKRLSEALVVRLQDDTDSLTGYDVLFSMIENNQLTIDQMSTQPPESYQYQLYEKLWASYNMLDPLIQKEFTLKQLLIDWMKESPTQISEAELLLCLHEDEALFLSELEIKQIKEGNFNLDEILIEQFQKGYLKPSQVSLDPSSASAVVIDVQTGEPLAIVGYPSYDSNLMTTDFNHYYGMLFDGFDKRSMLWNRALMTTKAPGSTFKMITALAGLEEGVITAETVIEDSGTFTKAGEPYPRCWVLASTGEGHGALDMTKALEVSCNYYFYEVAYRLGEEATSSYAGIDTLTKYVKRFGLDRKTGIELAEASPNVSTPQNLVTTKVNHLLEKFQTLKISDFMPYTKTLQYDLSQKGLDFSQVTWYNETTINEAVAKEMSKGLTTVLQPVYYDALEELIGLAFEEMASLVQIQKSELSYQIVAKTIGNEANLPLKQKVNQEFKSYFLAFPWVTLENRLEEMLLNLDQDVLLDVYEMSYRKVYEDLLDHEPTSVHLTALKETIFKVLKNTQIYQAALVETLKTYLIESILDTVFETVDLSWNDGVTVRTAIGQGNNAFSPLQVGRYIASLANGKEVLDLSLIKGVYDYKNNEGYQEVFQKVTTPLEIDRTYIQQVHEGMLGVVQDEAGTAYNAFYDFEVAVAGKTGTAEEGKHEHSWFVGFAPYENPEIAIVTTIYNADTLSRYGTYIAKDILTGYFERQENTKSNILESVWTD